MIKLTKVPEPETLRANAAAWTKILLDHETAGSNPTETELGRYNNTEIKTALRLETHRKCAYCEAYFDHVAHGDIEHIVPKKNGPKYRFSWPNLTLACSVCNSGKGSKDNIVDPYKDDVENIFLYEGPAILPMPDSADAIVSVIALRLNRPALVERRTERLENVHRNIVLALTNKNEIIKNAILSELEEHGMNDETEFAAMVRSYYKRAKELKLV